MKVLICGSRDWFNNFPIEEIIEQLGPGDIVIAGGARGADTLAQDIAEDMPGVSVMVFPADWNKYGKSAGYRRNIQMLEEKPDIVYAFPLGESKGTWHTIRAARERGIKTIVFGEK